ncbi:Hypp1689 [Branchiostoma lanceolatum]|uniref:Hypp1689 protein n=1 Tax=Branchiostoma lanceolatum TaxID=7740 RepID=A0A8K0ELS7_BRALA|nr:Hypp1689 [Branchiostoma lanceolatum]
MANLRLVFVLLVGLSAAVTATLWRDLDGLDNFLQTVMACETRRPVGLTISVVKDGDVVFSRGYGKRDLRQGLPVDNRTLFGMGSVSKSFTVTLLASILAESDNVTWDTPIVDILGSDFRFRDEFLTKTTTLRDVLVHRTGLQAFSFDLIQYGMDIDRAEFAR